MIYIPINLPNICEKAYNESRYSNYLSVSPKNSLGQVKNIESTNSIHDFNTTTSFAERAKQLISLKGIFLPNEFTVNANDTTLNCLLNVNSYFTSKNLTIFLSDPLVLLTILNDSNARTINPVLNLGILADEKSLDLYSNIFNQICHQMNNHINDNNNIVICDTSNHQTPDGSSFLVVNHIYMKNFCSNKVIQLSTFFKSSSGKFYFLKPVNSSLLPSCINEKTSYYGTLGDQQLFDPIEFIKIHINSESMKSSILLAPNDVIDFHLQLYSSKWLPCSKQNDSLEYPDNPSVNHNTKMSIVYLKELLRPLHVPFWLISGSLLGWFRECRAIPYTTDADFAAFNFSLNQQVVNDILSKTTLRRNKNNLHFLYRFGIISKGFELSFKLAKSDWKIDLFFMYPTSNFSIISTVGHATWNSEYYNYYYPSINSLCSTLLFQEKVNVPCNAKSIIETEYGHNWFQAKKDYSYIDSPSNRGPAIKWLPSDGDQVNTLSWFKWWFG